MGEQYVKGDTIEDCGNNEMKIRNGFKNEMKTLDEIPIKISVDLPPNLRAILRDIERRQLDGCYTFGDYLEEHGYEVTKNGKYVWFIKRR